jgi:hypothetical protein
VLDIPFCLLPLQQVALQGTFKPPEDAWIGGGKSAKVISNGHIIDFHYDPNSNLPTCKMAPDSHRFCTFIGKATGKTPAPNIIMQASQIHNHSPRSDSRSPRELFTKETPSIHPNNFHVLRCPVFVLVKELQDGKTIQKFSRAHSYMGIYVG